MTRSIVHDDNVKNGRPVLEGTNVGVHQIHVLLRDDDVTIADVVEGYPALTVDDVEFALKYYHNHPEEMREIEKTKREVRERMEEEGDVVEI